MNTARTAPSLLFGALLVLADTSCSEPDRQVAEGSATESSADIDGDSEADVGSSDTQDPRADASTSGESAAEAPVESSGDGAADSSSTSGGESTSGQDAGAETSSGSVSDDGSGEASAESEVFPMSCALEVRSSELAAIETVGVVTFTTDWIDLTSAEIHFGKTTDYGMVAPVDLEAPDYRTLLLGMTQSSTYNYRIVVRRDDEVCASENQTIQTGTLTQTGLGMASTSPGAAEGFIIAVRGGDAIIFDKEGELVWAHTFPGGVLGGMGIFRAHLSWDGRSVLARDLGPFDAGIGGTFHRIDLDGTGATSFDVPGGDHHDFAVIPGGFAYLAKENAGECDHIFTVDEDGGNSQHIVDLNDVFGQGFAPGDGGVSEGDLCHCNVIHYSSDGDFYTVSDRNKDAVVFVSGDGSIIATVGQDPAEMTWAKHIQAEGANSTWRVQHGHHWYADDKLIVFSNDSAGGSALLHYTLGETMAALDWSYSMAGNSDTQGDAQALPNGNFLVTASNAGVIHEIDANRNLISAYATRGEAGGVLGGFGYAWHHPTLYGPPAGR